MGKEENVPKVTTRLQTKEAASSRICQNATPLQSPLSSPLSSPLPPPLLTSLSSPDREIKDLNLIATEFRRHHHPCYRYFTRYNDNVKESVQQYEKEDFMKVEKLIMENNIKGHQVSSLKAIHKMYNLSDGDRRYCFLHEGKDREIIC